jgi:hypothetical protein
MQTKVTIDDFFTGFLSALSASKHLATIEKRGYIFDQALSEAFKLFLAEASLKSVFVCFRIKAHPVHGDSMQVEDGLANAARRDLISLDNPKYQRIRFKFSEEEGEKLLSDLPGGSEIYKKVAAEFLRVYDAIPA